MAGTPEEGFDRSPVDAATTTRVDTVSQSSLGTYVNCPRDYLFGRLVDSPDRDYFREGNLFHDFAEFYVSNPAFVDETVVDEAVEFMLDETRPFVRTVEEPTRRTTYRAGLETIVAFFEEYPPDDDGSLTTTGGWGRNAFADRFDRPADSPLTERWFENEDLGLKGKIDLVHSPTELFDYKSGRQKSATEVVGNAGMDPPSDTPDFQAPSYLAHWRSRVPDRPLEFTFFHFLEPLDDLVAGEVDLEDALTTVPYYPCTFADHARSERCFEDLIAEGANDCVKTLSQVAYEEYAGVFDEAPLPDSSDVDSDELVESEFATALTERMRDCVGDYAYVESGCKQALRQLARIRDRGFFEEDLDAFEAFVEDRIEELNRRRAGAERFPIEGLGGEPNYRYVDHRDMLLEGER